MAAETVCPRCGFKDSFIKGFLPGTCVCRICQSQLDWREIPGAGEDCGAVTVASDRRDTGNERGRTTSLGEE